MNHLPLFALLFLFCPKDIHANQLLTAGKQVNYCIADTMPGNCGKSVEIEKIITDAISLGAPIYNEGMHMACYRIYEWAGYKILYEYGKDCPDVEKILKTAIVKSHGDLSDTEKAWLMRMAFDRIMGVPTKTTGQDDTTPPKG